MDYDKLSSDAQNLIKELFATPLDRNENYVYLSTWKENLDISKVFDKLSLSDIRQLLKLNVYMLRSVPLQTYTDICAAMYQQHGDNNVWNELLSKFGENGVIDLLEPEEGDKWSYLHTCAWYSLHDETPEGSRFEQLYNLFQSTNRMDVFEKLVMLNSPYNHYKTGCFEEGNLLQLMSNTVTPSYIYDEYYDVRMPYEVFNHIIMGVSPKVLKTLVSSLDKFHKDVLSQFGYRFQYVSSIPEEVQRRLDNSLNV